MFTFVGPLDASKSWLNRAQIINFYNPLLEVNGSSGSDDVKHLKTAISDLKNGKSEFNIGEGGTSFRFFAILLSRKPGAWVIHASARLLERPQADLKTILDQLQVKSVFEKTKVTIRSDGWRIPPILKCSAEVSSQFISGLILNCWNLEESLVIEVQKPVVSADYLEMTIELVKRFRMGIQVLEKDADIQYLIPANQLPSSAQSVPAEIDISSAFALAAAAVIDGDATIVNWPSHSLQPDKYFLQIFERMGISFSVRDNTFSVLKHNSWKGIEADLSNTPDLFPVLSVLCALAIGTSYLYGAENLKSKESDRFAKTRELLSYAGFRSAVKNSGLVIYGQSSALDKSSEIQFDPDQDHRMAMAAAMLKLAGFNIKLRNPQCVQKSYPQFWQHIQVNL